MTSCHQNKTQTHSTQSNNTAHICIKLVSWTNPAWNFTTNKMQTSQAELEPI